MANLVKATLEPNHHNRAGAAVTLYFEGEPTRQEVGAALQKHRDLCLSDEDLDAGAFYEERADELSRTAGLRRFQVYP